MGIVGLVALLLLMLVPLFSAWAARRHLVDPAHRDLAQSLAAGLLVPMITCATFDVLSYQIMSAFTFILVGCCGALWRLEREAPTAGVPTGL